MKHIKVVSRASILDILNLNGSGELSLVETAIIMILSVFFSDWDNYASVIQNLQKFYQKT